MKNIPWLHICPNHGFYKQDSVPIATWPVSTPSEEGTTITGHHLTNLLTTVHGQEGKLYPDTAHPAELPSPVHTVMYTRSKQQCIAGDEILTIKNKSYHKKVEKNDQLHHKLITHTHTESMPGLVTHS